MEKIELSKIIVIFKLITQYKLSSVGFNLQAISHLQQMLEEQDKREKPRAFKPQMSVLHVDHSQIKEKS
jgi:hypothetical protein